MFPRTGRPHGYCRYSHPRPLNRASQYRGRVGAGPRRMLGWTHGLEHLEHL
ncbi:predicted protein [Streptomyces viridosporus ATCC 14672]|uniref:Predicted protein n=1 Tax=Streptomyces viridosporus (strain ATCC 14672 / DSM 40746 / JCM 4963 / KCTC 9882 / NRRL B-12104 / FH 1290) TaxID=566461 RepID=D5ZXW0_STRV1|nr:predicted protein [Streptomyces viridosporus ATCC 14672]